jgi:hypothetical protein
MQMKKLLKSKIFIEIIQAIIEAPAGRNLITYFEKLIIQSQLWFPNKFQKL